MATYVVGDVQGCFKSLQALLNAIAFDSQSDHIIFAGDLIARGEDSLGVIDWVLSHQSAVSAVLGNHDLHFLAVAAGLRRPKTKDQTDALLTSSILDDCVAWYRQCPLAIDRPDEQALIVHAGVWPGFDRLKLLEALDLVHERLTSADWIAALDTMYGNSPAHWDQADSEDAKSRFLINACTRMRYVEPDLSLDFEHKEAPEYVAHPLRPWMDHPARLAIDRQVIFGHWATLNGRRRTQAVLALDTGCVWGGQLTAVRLDDRHLIEVPHVI